MMARRVRCPAAALLAAAFLAAARAAAGPQVEGVWQGTLNPGPVALRLVLKVSRASSGELSATLDSVDQGARDLPLEGVALKDGVFRFEFRPGRGSFLGKLNAAGDEIAGTWTQGGQLPLTFRRTEKPPELRRPQEPKPPFPYDTEEVSYENPAAPGVKLAGTLTLPRGAGKFPAVLLISGSGPQDRDESLMGHKPFLVLADHLTRQGIAVLRVDDRGVGKSSGNFAASTSEDFASDAVAGVRYLKGHARVNPARIGLAGHSEGGLIAPMVAARWPAAESPGVAFLVLLAGTGVPGDQILLEQGALIARASGAPEGAVAANRAVQQKIFDVVRAEPDPAERLRKIREMVAPAGSAAAGQAEMAASPWFRFFLTYDPAPGLARVKCPVLAVNGALDTQVSAKQNLPAIERALRAGGNRDVTVKEFPGLNHLFQTARTGSPMEYGNIEETMSPAVLNAISAWIRLKAR
jgi:pimeloyl-ACP methyl ester carboxylesterase